MRWIGLVALYLMLMACGSSDEAASTPTELPATTTTTEAPTTTTAAPTTTTTQMSADESAIRDRYALLLTRFDNGLDPDHPGHLVLHPDRRADIIREIKVWASEGSTASGDQIYQVLEVRIDGDVAELSACRWGRTALIAADGSTLIPADPSPLLGTDHWLKVDGEWFSMGRDVSEETCDLQ